MARRTLVPVVLAAAVAFPAPGSYPFELDYFQQQGTMSLVLGLPGAGGGGAGGPVVARHRRRPPLDSLRP